MFSFLFIEFVTEEFFLHAIVFSFKVGLLEEPTDIDQFFLLNIVDLFRRFVFHLIIFCLFTHIVYSYFDHHLPQIIV